MVSKQCQNLLGALSDYIDGELEGAVCAELESHLSGCENCRIVVDTLKRTVSLYKVVSNETSTPNGVHQRLLQRLELDAFRSQDSKTK
jgi:predicted anti-sigma-YlaC factor YlaD